MPNEAVKPLPLRKDRFFHGVSHALGHLLGDALYRGFEGTFRDPPQTPRDI